MIGFELNNNVINGVQIDEYCKQHCESCIHNCVCDNKNKEGLITYFEGLKVSKNNSALFDNVEFVCPYHKEEEKNDYSDSNKMYQQILDNSRKKNEIQELKDKNKQLEESNRRLKQQVEGLEAIRSSYQYLLKCEETKNKRLNKLLEDKKDKTKTEEELYNDFWDGIINGTWR